MTELHLDIETYCDIDLKKVGVYAYSESPTFKVLLTAHAVNDDPVIVNEGFPRHLIDKLQDRSVLKIAHNANFEITCLSAFLKIELDPSQWLCTMNMARQLGLPGSLDQVAQVLNLSEQKDKEGARLIRLFSGPSKLKKREGDWQAFMSYCKQDVETERAIHHKLRAFMPPSPATEFEHRLWCIDQAINKRGVMIDKCIAANAIEIADKAMARNKQKLKEVTGLDNVSDAQLKAWMERDSRVVKIDSLSKSQLPDIRRAFPQFTEMLELREQTRKTSTAKYQTMLGCACSDSRARGLTQYYGAGRTGRWSGRLIQLQNLPGIKINDEALNTAREALKSGDTELFEHLYGGEELSILSQLIRTAIVPQPGYRFVVADFSSIEARVLAWIANEKWRLDVFNGSGKIYETSAERMFNLPTGSVDKSSPYRQKGKVAELALGYGGGVGALINMGALAMGLTENELQPLVDLWRQASPNVVAFWRLLDAALRAVLTGAPVPRLPFNMLITNQNGLMQVQLPNGRKLSYVRPFINGREIGYEGMNQMTNKWEVQKLYGAKLTENIVQAIARDCLAHVLVFAEIQGLRPVFHVHDEVVCEVAERQALQDYQRLLSVMKHPAQWTEGLPLGGDGFVSEYYKK